MVAESRYDYYLKVLFFPHFSPINKRDLLILDVTNLLFACYDIEFQQNFGQRLL